VQSAAADETLGPVPDSRFRAPQARVEMGISDTK
jgi:hypothetical protein